MGSELIPEAALFICQAALLAIAPVAFFAAGTRVVNSMQDARLPWTPFVELAALWTGVAAGVIILIQSVDVALVGPSQVFQKGGPWDLSFGEFLAQAANPFRYDLSAVLPVPFSGRLPTAAGFVVFLLSGLVIYAPPLVFRSRRAIANGIRNAFIVVCSAYFTIYAFAYSLWLLNKLNFWVFLLLMFLIHQRRRSERIVLKLN